MRAQPLRVHGRVVHTPKGPRRIAGAEARGERDSAGQAGDGREAWGGRLYCTILALPGKHVGSVRMVV